MFALLLLISLGWTMAGTMKADLPQMLTLYRTNEQLAQDVDYLTKTYRTRISLSFCPQDTGIKMLQLGRSSDNFTVLITCNVHPREVFASEVCLSFVREMLEKNSDLLDRFRFKVLYNANPERRRVFEGEYCVRGNKNGVDLNRNFPSGWSAKGDGIPGDNPGPFPLSQTYSQCVDYLAKNLKPLAYVDLHTGESSLLYFRNQSSTQRAAPQIRLLASIKNKFCRGCRVANIADLTAVLGEGIVYLKEVHKVKYSNLFEMYGGYKEDLPFPDRCLAIFSPQTRRQLKFYLRRWVDALNYYFWTIYRNERGK